MNGTNSDRLTVSGNNQTRIFRIFQGVKATINNLKNANGNTPANSFSGCPSGNDASFGGGAIENRGVLFINNSVITDNSINGSGGALSNVYGMMTLTNTVVKDNRAGSSAGGIVNIGINGLTNSDFGSLSLINSEVSNNDAFFEYGSGGGIGNYDSATLTIINSTVHNDQSVRRRHQKYQIHCIEQEFNFQRQHRRCGRRHLQQRCSGFIEHDRSFQCGWFIWRNRIDHRRKFRRR